MLFVNYFLNIKYTAANKKIKLIKNLSWKFSLSTTTANTLNTTNVITSCTIFNWKALNPPT